MYILYSIILILISMIEYIGTSDNTILPFGDVLNIMSLLCLVIYKERVLFIKVFPLSDKQILY